MKILFLMVGLALILGTVIHQPTLAQPDDVLVPITEMQADYGQESPKLYGPAGNTIPPFYRPVVQHATDKIAPLDDMGNPSQDGQIGFLSIGMSNTSQEFSAFMQLAAAQDQINPAVVLVNGAQGGMDSVAWNTTETPWKVVFDERLVEAELTPEQIQVIWLEIEVRSITEYASDDEGQKTFRVEQIKQLIERLTVTFPNVRMIYLSARSYGGFYNSEVANNTSIPEPLSYEHGFAVRQVILDHLREAQPKANDPATYDELLPVVIWGPYFWAGETPREDGLYYVREDFARDGIHPSPQGQQKIAKVMLDFFLTDPTTQSWFISARDEP